uniref:Alkaline ceramidase n=1 Tax=Palpitomonas bilix TaxID=652834 RepID=A0A7S3GDW2_9EUKA|mmetsp:Transcript_45195/g.116946  ORF Transcript_45195/g.116946 Transcript_45195/m.116946 type:complete len:366 (+) Transcript_45195:104-1201(+)
MAEGAASRFDQAESDASVTGLWGESTSTIDWCEANYVVCFYIAEFWNTISNLGMICIAAWGMWQVKSLGLEARIRYSFLSLFVVGIGSWCFHATLLYWMQLLDELPMIYGTCIFLFAVWEDRPDHRWQRHLIVILFSYALIVTGLYVFVIHDPVFFQTAYGSLVIILVFKFVLNLRDPSIQMEERKNRHQPESRPTERMTLHATLFTLAIGSYLCGFILWNLENAYCSYFRAIRTAMGGSIGLHEHVSGPHAHPPISQLFPFLFPNGPDRPSLLDAYLSVEAKDLLWVYVQPALAFLAPVFELHAWWHVFSGYGTYVQIIAVAYLRTLLREKWGIEQVGRVQLRWWFMLPYLTEDEGKDEKEKTS